MKRLWLIVIGSGVVCGVSGAAVRGGEPTYEPRLAFAAGWGPQAPVVEVVEVSEAGQYLFSVMGGIFDATGFEEIPSPPGVPQGSSNRGVGSWLGRIASSEPVLNYEPGPLPAFDNPLVEPIGTPSLIIVGVERQDPVVAWPSGLPVAPQPQSLGNEMLTRLYLFSVMIEDVAVEREIVITATGVMVAIANWSIVQQVPPMGGQNGMTVWESVEVVPGMDVEAVLRVRVVPGVGTGVVVVGGWVAMCWGRRRRGG